MVAVTKDNMANNLIDGNSLRAIILYNTPIVAPRVKLAMLTLTRSRSDGAIFPSCDLTEYDVAMPAFNVAGEGVTKYLWAPFKVITQRT
jgi:hypothetical protein